MSGVDSLAVVSAAGAAESETPSFNCLTKADMPHPEARQEAPTDRPAAKFLQPWAYVMLSLSMFLKSMYAMIKP